MNNILIQGFSEQATKIFHNLSKSILFCQQQTRKMFSFCCGESKKDQYYTVLNKNNRNSQPQTYNYIDEKQARSFLPHMQILKVKQSQYLQLVSHYSNGNLKWEDISFPPNSNSLGKIPQIKDQSWKRLSEIISNPVLFDGRIEPQDAIQGSLGDCYFLSAVSALAEKQERIRRIFGDQPGSKNGIYRVILRINGIIEEIIIDDYVPVNKQGVPIFCQPNKNEIWVPLFEKAWAKANGSYENIISGIPTQIFKAATYSPSQLIQTGSTKEQNERLWKIILDSAKKDRACCGGTCDDEDILWGTIGLVQGHAYTLIDAAELTDKQNNRVRVLKLRNPWGNTQWSGEGNENDTKFWNMIKNNEEKQLFLKDSSVNNDGIFYILFKDYCKFFNQTHICYMQKDGNYVFQNYQPSKKGAFWKIQIFNEGQYIFQLHQEGGRSKQEQDNILSRGTLLLIKKSEKYQFISGTMAYFQQDISLKAKLQQGSYILYSKFDLSLKTKKYPQNASISIYSLEYAIIQLLDTLKCKQILRQAFISYGKQNKKKKYEDGTLWISNKLLFKQGGYAFVVFGVEKQAKFKWQVKFNQSDFSSGAFKLKKPYKRKGQNQIFEVLPGKQEIILVRIKNQNVKNVKFPPPIEWKMLSL